MRNINAVSEYSSHATITVEPKKHEKESELASYLADFSRKQLQKQRPFKDLQINILGYYGSKDTIYSNIPMLCKKSLLFLRESYDKLESQQMRISHANERIKFLPVKSIEEHSSGIN